MLDKAINHDFMVIMIMTAENYLVQNDLRNAQRHSKHPNVITADCPEKNYGLFEYIDEVIDHNARRIAMCMKDSKKQPNSEVKAVIVRAPKQITIPPREVIDTSLNRAIRWVVIQHKGNQSAEFPHHHPGHMFVNLRTEKGQSLKMMLEKHHKIQILMRLKAQELGHMERKSYAVEIFIQAVKEAEERFQDNIYQWITHVSRCDRIKEILCRRDILQKEMHGIFYDITNDKLIKDDVFEISAEIGDTIFIGENTLHWGNTLPDAGAIDTRCHLLGRYCIAELLGSNTA